MDKLYDVVRTDDHGNTYTIKVNLLKREADVLVKQMTEKGHKQTYEAKEQEDGVIKHIP